jgi:acetyltransferase-like isoleucine patch superfamily enzyme
MKQNRIALVQRVKRRARLRRSVGANVAVGDRVSIGVGSRLRAPRSLVIGDDVAIGSGVRIEVDGRVGDCTLIANDVGIVGRSPELRSRPVTIGADVWLGFRCVVLSGVTIGDSSVVGAGAVVVQDIPPNSIVVGSPARVIRQRFGPEEFVRHWRALRQRGVSPLTSLDDQSAERAQ